MALNEKRERYFMQRALQLAKCSFESGEVPVGALIVIDDAIIAEGRNRVEERQDPTAHAEIEAIRAACSNQSSWRLIGADLYTTLEPCAMCLGAAISSRCQRIIWGASDLRQGALGSWCDLLKSGHPIHNLEQRGGCMMGQSRSLLRAFFQARRIEKRKTP